jgi:hypothetical protein
MRPSSCRDTRRRREPIHSCSVQGRRGCNRANRHRYQFLNLTAYFQMDDNGDLHEQILQIEAHLEELTDVIERCRKIILISKAAVAVGGTLILAIIIGAVSFDPTVMIGAIAAVIGGMVVFGSNTSTLVQNRADVKAAEAHRAELISRMHLRVVGDGQVES